MNRPAVTTQSASPADTTLPGSGDADPAGEITLSGRNKACARARALAGLVLTSGIVVTLSTLDTSVSGPGGSM